MPDGPLTHLGASDAVIDRYAAAHRKECTQPGEPAFGQELCPCGRTVVLICTPCQGVAFAGTRTKQPCRHFYEVPWKQQ